MIDQRDVVEAMARALAAEFHMEFVFDEDTVDTPYDAPYWRKMARNVLERIEQARSVAR